MRERERRKHDTCSCRAQRHTHHDSSMHKLVDLGFARVMSKLSEETRAVNDLDVGPADVAQMLGDSSLLELLREAQLAERGQRAARRGAQTISAPARRKLTRRGAADAFFLSSIAQRALWRRQEDESETEEEEKQRWTHDVPAFLLAPQWCRSGESSACSTSEEFRTTRAEVPAAALRSYTRTSSSDKKLPNTSEAILANL